MNEDEIKLTKYIHSVIDDNNNLRKENDRLWKQKLEYLNRLNKAVDYIKQHSNNASEYLDVWEVKELLEILKGSNND